MPDQPARIVLGETIIGDRYRLDGRLGRGGMGAVFRAHDTRLARDVALKILRVDQGDPQAAFYFHREARAAAALQHPNIVPVFDYSGPKVHPLFLVMELVDGLDGRHLVHEHGPLPGVVIYAVASGLAAAVAHAHQHEVLHRDLKPANFIVSWEGRVLLADFGLAKGYLMSHAFGNTVTNRATSLFGTPAFLSPEQVGESELGLPSDVFSLGSLLYSLAADTSPFYDSDPLLCMDKISRGEFVPLAAVRTDLDPAFATMLDRCFVHDPAARPTAAEMATICRQCQHAVRLAEPEQVVREFLAAARSHDPHAADTADLGSGPSGRAAAASAQRPAERPAERPAAPEKPEARGPGSGSTPARAPASPPTPAMQDRKETSARMRPEPAAWRRLVPLAMAIAGVTLGVVVGASLFLGEPASAPAPAAPTPSAPAAPAPAAPTPAAPAPAAPAPAAPTPAELVEIPIEITGGTKVSLDGKLVGQTPALNHLAATPGLHTVTLEHRKHGKRVKKVRFAEGEKLVVDMKGK